MEENQKKYKIQNKITREWWEGEAGSTGEACTRAGWADNDCWIIVKTYWCSWAMANGKESGKTM